MTSYLLALLLHIFLIRSQTSATTPHYTATDFILLSCGSSGNSNDTSGRLWDSDERSRYAPSNADAVSSASTASRKDSSVSVVPYATARVFRSSFTYSFPVSAGHKFLRLYFYPDFYSNLNTSQSFFSVSTRGFTLLSNFSAYLHSKNSTASFMKEFVIRVEESQRLILTFSPNPDSFAFVNGIEIVSIPEKLYFRGNDVPILSDGQQYYLNNNTALENLYRLNVGGGYVDVGDDTGMYRAWSPDYDYILFANVGWERRRDNIQIVYPDQTPPYTAAPAAVYTSARIMNERSKSQVWGFPVDSGFFYLLRLHFCEFMEGVTKQHQRVFDIYLDNRRVDYSFDIISSAHGPLIPIFSDYMIWVPDDGHRGKLDLLLSLSPYDIKKFDVPLLNGLELFKLNDTKGSFAAANPELVQDSSPPAAPAVPPPTNKSGASSLIYAIVGSAIGVVAVAAALAFLILRRRRRVKDSVTTSKSWVLLSSTPPRSTKTNGSSSGASLPSNICRSFSLDEIRTATRHFDCNLVVGEAGFGKVYKGLIDDGSTTVAIKRLNPLSNQGLDEFLTEIKMLSKLRHLNLVSLIGYCDEYGEMILVYDYMAHGTLRSHLYGSEYPPLTWNQRLRICLGAAKGLDYLHTSTEHAIIHRDVKTTNILLDEKWVAKMSDFGLSKVGPTGGAQTHVSTAVKGSFGYVDPEYYRRRQLTEKSDVYSFGVVLFEVLCGRPAVVSSLPKEEANLAEWAKFCLKDGKLEKIVDANLNGQITPECFNKFAETAAACVRDKGIERPAMNDVIWSLEFALQLQETAVESTEGGMTDEEMSSWSSQVAGSKSR